MRIARFLVFALLFATSASAPIAQAPGAGTPAGTPPRDASPGPTTPTGSRLSGRVVAAGTQQPLYRAVVQLLTGNLQPSRWTSTDIGGRWSFADVTAGSYTLVASRDGYVTMGYGQRGAFGAPAPVVLAGNAAATGLDIALPRGGVIAGRITDDLGEPMAGVTVRAHRVRFVNGLRQLVGTSSTIIESGSTTNDRGEYRLFGLAPGTYFLSAGYAEVGRGRADDRSTFANTYAPGTASAADAAPFVVNLDRETNGDFSLVRTSLVVVSGRLVDPSGQPSFGTIRLTPVAPGHAIAAALGLGTRSESGSFALRGVPPGNYYLHATAAGSTSAPPTLAVVPLTVSGEDVRDLLIQTAPASFLRGVLRTGVGDPQISADGFYVGATPLDGGATSVRGVTADSRTDRSGAFVIPGLLGRHLIRLQNLTARPGWWLKSVTIDGIDVTDTGYNFQPGRDVTAEVVVSTRMASVSGTVRNRDGRAVADCSVVAFALDETRWGPYTRFIASVGPAQDGSFRLEGLPAGDYVVIAVPPLESGEETDPDRLKTWRGLGQPVSLGEVEVKIIGLVLVQ